MLPKPLASAIISIVTIIWAIDFAAQFFVPEYQSSPTISGVFMAIVGGALALSRKGDGNNSNSSGHDQSTRQRDQP